MVETKKRSWINMSDLDLLVYTYTTHHPRISPFQLRAEDTPLYRALQGRRLTKRLDRIEQAKKFPQFDASELISYAATKYHEMPLEDLESIDLEVYNRIIDEKLVIAFLKEKGAIN